MKFRKITYLGSIIVVALMGVALGYGINHKYTHCLEINFSKQPFYGKFAQNLKETMQNLGYNTSCSCIWPKTVLDFTYTDSQKWHQQEIKKRKQDLNLALVGDCYDAYNIDFLKTYDYILAVNELRFGYIAMFNFKAVHFPIRRLENVFLYHCDSEYLDVKIDVEKVAQNLDDIIKRAWHDK